jgi:hypothetical protein
MERKKLSMAVAGAAFIAPVILYNDKIVLQQLIAFEP